MRDPLWVMPGSRCIASATSQHGIILFLTCGIFPSLENGILFLSQGRWVWVEATPVLVWENDILYVVKTMVKKQAMNIEQTIVLPPCGKDCPCIWKDCVDCQKVQILIYWLKSQNQHYLIANHIVFESYFGCLKMHGKSKGPMSKWCEMFIDHVSGGFFSL